MHSEAPPGDRHDGSRGNRGHAGDARTDRGEPPYDDERAADGAATGATSSDAATGLTRRRFVQASAATGLGAAGLGASSSAGAQPGSGVPSYEEAASQLSHPDPAEEAVALYRYLHAEWGERILSGQQHETWGIDEIQYVEDVTGRRPAVKGVDFIHGKARPVDWAIDWWEQGGITKAMWHWGVPGQETPEDEYEQSRDTGVQIDLQLVLEEGTEPNQAFRDEMAEVADELERARDQGVPIVWGPFHEFEGGWFWWGVEGADYFVELWETMHEYFVHERDLDNLIWLLPHMDRPDPDWVPDESTFDLAGADTYSDGDSYSWLYDNVTSVHGEDRPIVMHEIGRDGGVGQPPDPDAAAEEDVWWSMWVNWHTDWLERIEDSYLDHVYNHELTVTLDDVPDVVAEYGGDGECEPTPIEPYVRVDGGEWQQTGSVTVEVGTTVELGPRPADGGDWSWSGDGVSAETRVLELAPESNGTYTATYTNECDATSSYEFSVTAESVDACVDAAGGSLEVEGQTVCDQDGDGYFRDVNSDGFVRQDDVVAFFENQHKSAWKRDAFDFSGNGDVNQFDVVELFDYVVSN